MPSIRWLVVLVLFLVLPALAQGWRIFLESRRRPTPGGDIRGVRLGDTRQEVVARLGDLP